MLRDALRALLEAAFRVLFTYDCLGEEKIPAEGPALIAANHPSYLDPILLSLQVKRPIRFMAWDALFRVPLLGALMRLFGAFPVDVREGAGRSGYAAARELLGDGELVGIFPEGRRSREGWLEPELRAGAARLALETGAPLVPATIRGAFRAWPHFHALPGLATIRVRYHDPIEPATFASLSAEQATSSLLAELRRRVERTLMPGVKADAKIEALWRGSAPWPRLFEAGPALALALLVFWKTRAFSAVWPCYAYIGYLLLDLLLVPQRRLTKWIRNGSAAAFVLAYGAWALPRLGLPALIGGRALLALIAGAGFAYLYERSRIAIGFVQGLVAAALLELGAQQLAPNPLGPHLALPLFAAAYAWEERSVFWRYAAPLLLAYALVVPSWLAGGALAAAAGLLPHAVAGLLAWVVVRFLPSGAASREEVAEPEDEPRSTLGLRD
jgi:1-acyl-sn-glycerol-3-phosphate acyltransferase